MKFGKRALATLVSVFSLTSCLSFVHQPRTFISKHTRSSTLESQITCTSSFGGVARSNNSKNTRGTVLRMGDEDDEIDDEEDYDPLSDGVDSVSWLQPLSSIGSSGSVPAEVRSGAEILPLFPLGGIVYTPNSEHVLNIFEPRYRQMYTDILMNGSKRFVVSMSHPEKEGTFAQVGVIFHLEDLKEVSEETGDAIKYICNHKVTERVKLHNILNPDAWTSRDTYLKVEATILEEDDIGDDENLNESMKDNDIYRELVGALSSSRPKSKEEKELSKAFSNLVDRQHDLEEEVRFTRASVETLAVAPGNGENGLWQTIRLWQSFIEQRLLSRQNEMQREFQEKLIDFLKKEKGISESEIPSAIGFDDLSPALQQEVQDLQKRMSKELQPMVLESTLAIQKIIEAEGHTARCELLQHFINAEVQRLSAKKTLQGMFDGTAELAEEVEIEEDEDIEEDKNIAGKSNIGSKSDDKDGPGASGSLLVDEPDAFQ